MIGRSIGSYQILAELGRGGMGEVYRARDTALNRDVALKVMPEALAGDPDRLARFQREAESLAALNHPNIAQIYGIEESRSRGPEVPGSTPARAIVMELVDGEDLSEIVARGPISTDDTLAIARQLIDALEAAHERGIIHRDLKPANIKVREDGTVKVLDFGLARTLDPGPGTQDTSNSPTLTARATQMGMIIGTAAYMSPEQARGRPVDKRTDVWAFGCVLFEMLTGRRAFDGEDATEIISAVVKSEPDWTVLPATVPSHVRTVIERCLLKDRKTRIPDLSVVRYMLDETIVPADATSATPPAWWQRPIPLVGVLVLLAGAIAATWAVRGTPDMPARIVSLDEPGAKGVEISPDGASVLFIRDGSLWVRRLDEPAGKLLVDGSGFQNGVLQATWSPERDVVAYDDGIGIMRMPIASGNAARIGESDNGVGYGMHWGASGRLLVSKGGGYGFRVLEPGGGANQLLPLAEGDTRFFTPWELPNGQVMFSQRDRGLIEVFDGQTRHVVLDVSGAVVQSAIATPDGRVMYAQQGANEGVWVAPYDPDTWTLGEPAAVSSSVGQLSVSRTGLLAIDPVLGEPDSMMVQVDSAGEVVRALTDEQSTFHAPALSPDGLRLAVSRFSSAAGNARVFVYDLERGTSVELGVGVGGTNHRNAFWIDDNRVGYMVVDNDHFSLMVEDISSPGGPRLLADGVASGAVSVSKSYVAYRSPDDDLWYLNLDSGGSPVRFRQTAAAEYAPALSPDGRYVAYIQVSAGSDKNSVFVERFPDGGGLQAVRTDLGDRLSGGGGRPVWSADGTELLFAIGTEISAVAFDPARGVPTSAPRTLFDFPYRAGLGGVGATGFVVTREGQFIMQGPNPDARLSDTSALPTIIENWTKLLEGGR